MYIYSFMFNIWLRFFRWKFLVFFLFLLHFKNFSEQVIVDKLEIFDSDISNLMTKYFDTRNLTLTNEEERCIRAHSNHFGWLDLYFPRKKGFDSFPKEWYECSDVQKKRYKQQAIKSFISSFVDFFSNKKKLSSGVLSPSIIRDSNILDEKSPFDKIVDILDIFSNRPSYKIERVSFDNLVFLFRLLNAYNNSEDIEDVIESNEVLLSNRDTMLELFSILNSLREDDDFYLHFNDTIDFLQQCGFHRGEYECYLFDNFKYEQDVSDWNGFLLNNFHKTEKFDFNKEPSISMQEGYSTVTRFNPYFWIAYFLSKQFKDRWPNILEIVNTWQIDDFLLGLTLLIILIVIEPVDSIFFKIIYYFARVVLSTFLFNRYIMDKFVAFIKRRKIHIPAFSFIEYAIRILFILRSGFNAMCQIGPWPSLVLLLLIPLILLVLVPNYIMPLYYSRAMFNILFSNDILRIRRYVRNMRDFYLKIRDKNENIKSLFIKYLPQCSSLFDIDINENESLNDEQKELFNLIFTDREIPAGDVPRFYFLFYKYKDLLQKIIVEIQYVGSYVNAMMLVNSGKFCIPKFRYSGDNYIKMQDVVHPYLIDGGVRNSFEIGEKETGIRNMIFSGSNGTGKTTFQFAVVDNVILSQSLGIACCSEYLATPFDKIISMSNAKTDLSEGLSGYTSEVEMVKDCLSYLSENKDKRILLISDEPLSTTDPDFADWIVELIFRGVFSYPNVTSIVATHFNSPIQIEKKYKDLHAGNFRFKVEDKGTSLENFHLLEHGEGCNIGKTIAKQRGLLDLINAITGR